MLTTFLISLDGQTEPFRLDAAAHARLLRSLDEAVTRFRDDADPARSLRDLERAVGGRLAVTAGSRDRDLGIADIEGALRAIGWFDAGATPPTWATRSAAGPRRLRRVREGQQVAGVCLGIATYAELDVAWVRTFFVLASLATAGLVGLVYMALAVILPITATARIDRANSSTSSPA